MPTFDLRRTVRTGSGENYAIFHAATPSQARVIGSLDLHIANNVYHGTLVLTSKLKKKDLELLLAQIDEQLVDKGREDFIFTVYRGKEVGFYSDVVDRKYDSATKGDIEDVHAALRKVLGRHQHAKAQLSEHAVCAYLEAIGYRAKRGGPKLDAQKIDVVADNKEEIIYAQVKVGAISEKEMADVVDSAASLAKSDQRKGMVAIFAGRFSHRYEFHRVSLENKYGIRVLCIPSSDVVESNPEYRRTLGGNT